MSCMSQNFRLFQVSNLSVRNFRFFLLMFTGINDLLVISLVFQFVFESEKAKESAGAKLMNDIRSGVKLKRVRCNDRSRPNLQGKIRVYLHMAKNS